MASPLVIAPKRDGDIRIIFDTRVANQAIKRERHPIPTVEEIVQEMRGACHFSKLRFMLRVPWIRAWCSVAKSNYVFNTFWVSWTQNVTLGVTTTSKRYQQTLERNIFYDLQNVRNISDDVIISGKNTKKSKSSARTERFMFTTVWLWDKIQERDWKFIRYSIVLLT